MLANGLKPVRADDMDAILLLLTCNAEDFCDDTLLSATFGRTSGLKSGTRPSAPQRVAIRNGKSTDVLVPEHSKTVIGGTNASFGSTGRCLLTAKLARSVVGSHLGM